jgi:hypothetical protein
LQAISIAMAMPVYRVFEFAQVITPLNKKKYKTRYGHDTKLLPVAAVTMGGKQ